MANISSLLNTIKNAIYGRDMRSALHDVIKAVNDDTETRLKRSGGTMTGGITMNGNKVTSSATPSTDSDYTNKKYVDAQDKAYAAYSNSKHPNSTTVKAALDEAFSKIDEKGQPNGYAELDANGLIPTEQLPPITITETYVVNTQAAMLALSAQVGDVAIRTDLSKSFILQNEPASTLANWQELLTPTDAVQSVAGKTGVVVLTKSDVGLGNVDNTADSNKKVLSASKLTTPRTINGVSFDGSANITIADNTKEPKITAGTASQMWVGTKRWASILTTVQSVLLTGLSTATNSAITASDNIIKALGKLQAQINARLPLKGGTMTGSINMGENKITSSAIPSADDDYTNKKYVDDAISSATMLDCEITDSDGGKLLDSDGQSIFGRVNVITAIANINDTLDKLKEHSILDSTF